MITEPASISIMGFFFLLLFFFSFSFWVDLTIHMYLLVTCKYCQWKYWCSEGGIHHTRWCLVGHQKRMGIGEQNPTRTYPQASPHLLLPESIEIGPVLQNKAEPMSTEICTWPMVTFHSHCATVSSQPWKWAYHHRAHPICQITIDLEETMLWWVPLIWSWMDHALLQGDEEPAFTRCPHHSVACGRAIKVGWEGCLATRLETSCCEFLVSSINSSWNMLGDMFGGWIGVQSMKRETEEVGALKLVSVSAYFQRASGTWDALWLSKLLGQSSFG